ncbi:aminoglycoside phosphotransferase family protein [Patescibacteria group bacterium]|nr:aminoglycoside phosphotransferase family protein [Patescibacteria group bacterium]
MADEISEKFNNKPSDRVNKIYHLLDEKFVLNLFKEKILPEYPRFSHIKEIKITLIKDHIWVFTYHVVIKYKITFINLEKKLEILPIYCTAHSDESRLNSFEALTFLWQNGFNQKNLTIPRSLFYSPDFNAFFYQGVNGEDLYQYILRKDVEMIEAVVVKVATWLTKLHNLSVIAAKGKIFNHLNSRIETIIPGMTQALIKVQAQGSRYFEICREAYRIINQKEKDFFSSTDRRWLIHGDAHPKNIIIDKNKIGVIDFTDICLADYARDLGTFLQQLEFMMFRKIENQAQVEKIKQLFLNNYLKNAKITLDDNLQKRINNYYNWTALRSAIVFLLKDKAEPERAHDLLIKISQDLKLDIII